MSPVDVLFAGSLVGPFMLGAAGVAISLARVHRVGGLLHWRIGRLGGSFYLARRTAM